MYSPPRCGYHAPACRTILQKCVQRKNTCTDVSTLVCVFDANCCAQRTNNAVEGLIAFVSTEDSRGSQAANQKGHTHEHECANGRKKYYRARKLPLTFVAWQNERAHVLRAQPTEKTTCIWKVIRKFNCFWGGNERFDCTFMVEFCWLRVFASKISLMSSFPWQRYLSGSLWIKPAGKGNNSIRWGRGRDQCAGSLRRRCFFVPSGSLWFPRVPLYS